ncbi:hypothetical protein [Phenylobacterium montanum]|uniref:Uncharacterized protein n=1 Tax=Phenylobacterium montanum TaxID=2823693 RepID=A0A975FWU4_9CAUL|nr:hypothetical protein [Caulobacter sp. S6]QUD86719.1 hypothetical protein KCG34_16765 [Caulobacter sp. S6]
MAASACLRILLDISDEKLARLDALGPLVTRVTNAFLQARWAPPKRFVVLTPYSFMLTDPQTHELDVMRLQQLAAELKQQLFGSSDTGEVTLLLHDGDESATARFVTIDHQTLRRVTIDPSQPLPFAGRVLKLSTAFAGSGADLGWERIDNEPGAGGSLGRRRRGGPRFHGVYFKVSQCFVGSGVSAPITSSVEDFNLFGDADQLPGEAAVEFDMACLKVAADHLSGRPWSGALFVPVSFVAVLRPATRDTYMAGFARLPREKRYQLVAAVYDVPRMPGRHAFVNLRDMLDPHFSQIDLQINDPGFDLENVPAGAVNTVTLRLPDGNEMVRSQAIRRFAEKRPTFKRLQISAAYTNVCTKAELTDCLKQPISFVSGYAVCGPLRKPVGAEDCPPADLPWISA